MVVLAEHHLKAVVLAAGRAYAAVCCTALEMISGWMVQREMTVLDC
jgi:hypothetical protein